MINNLRWIGALGAVYVACAAVGTAQASPDDRAEARGPGALAAASAPMSGWLERAVARATPVSPVIHADDRSGLRGSDRLVLAAPPPPTIAPAGDGLAWDDAALSAVASLAVGVLLGAGAVSIRYRHGLTLR